MQLLLNKTKMHIVRAVISFIICLLCCTTILLHPPHKSVSAKTLNKLSELNETAPGNYVNLKIDKLYYTGLDSKNAKTVNGHYYYNITDNKCTLFLLSDDSTKKLNSESTPEEISNYSIQGRIIEDENFNTKLRAQFSKQINWSNYELSKMTYPYLVSEINTEKEISLKPTIILLILAIFFLISTVTNIIIYLRKRTKPKKN